MHEHRHGNPDKLEAGLPYLLKHNREHVEDIRRWIHRAQEAGRWKIADDLQKVLNLSEQISKHLENSVGKLESGLEKRRARGTEEL